MSKIAIYARKSTESEDRQVLSLDSQVSELKSFAKNEGYEIIQVLTESKSAKAPGRPVFNKLISDIQHGKIDAILCWKLDRLARNPIDGGNIIWALEEKKLEAIHTPQRTFFNTGNDKFWMALEFGISKKYVDDLSDNVKRGLRARLEKGWITGRPPIGYLNNKENRTIIRDPNRFLLVRKIWDLMLSGEYSPNAIINIATEKWGLRTRKFKRFGGGPLGYSIIYKILTNPFYYGMIVRRGEYYQGAHEPMVTKSEFEKVQNLLQTRSNKRPKRHTFPYTGMITCGECGASITAEHRINRYGSHYIYYHCTKRKRTVRCKQPYIREEDLEIQMSSFLESITIMDDFKNWAIEVLRNLQEEEEKKSLIASKSLQKRLEGLKSELSELINIKLRGMLTDEEYLEKKAELEGERTRLKEIIFDSEKNYERTIRNCEGIFEFACNAKERFENGNSEEKKTIIINTCSNLILKNKLLHISAQKPFVLLQKGLINTSSKTKRFEPVINDYGQHKMGSEKGPEMAYYRLVKEVRTFFMEKGGHS